MKIKSVILYATLVLAALLAYGPVRTKIAAHTHNNTSVQKTPTSTEFTLQEQALKAKETSAQELELIETQSIDNTPTSHTEPAQVWINVFVHGIMSIKPHLNMSNFMRFMRDDVENTTYAKTVEIMRQDDFFYKNQAMQGFGFKKVDPSDTTPGNASSALASILNDVVKISHGPNIENHYYTYGWSGLLSPTKRYKDAIELYKNIEQTVQYFNQKGITPKIRVFGYSHGGNVVLNLGAVRQREAVRKDLVIDEMLLIGTPIQKETDYLVNDQLFKKVYNIFSACDRVQKMDFFSFNRAFSRRILSDRDGFILPKKLVQIQLKLTRLTPAARKNPRKVAASFNFNSRMILSGKSHLLRDSSPGHGELWFFGWTPVHYRENFALNPLPAVAITPFILKTVQEVENLLIPGTPVIFDMRPEHGVTIIKNIRNQTFYRVVDFLPHDTLLKLKEKARTYAPQNYTCEAYEECVQKAYRQAHDFYQKEWSLQARRKQHYNSRKERKKARIEARKAKKTQENNAKKIPSSK